MLPSVETNVPPYYISLPNVYDQYPLWRHCIFTELLLHLPADQRKVKTRISSQYFFRGGWLIIFGLHKDACNLCVLRSKTKRERDLVQWKPFQQLSEVTRKRIRYSYIAYRCNVQGVKVSNQPLGCQTKVRQRIHMSLLSVSLSGGFWIFAAL